MATGWRAAGGPANLTRRELDGEDNRRRRQAGCVLLLGDPGFYGRFGFEAAGPLGIYYGPVGRGDPHFLVRRLDRFDASLRGEFTYCWEGERRTATT